MAGFYRRRCCCLVGVWEEKDGEGVLVWVKDDEGLVEEERKRKKSEGIFVNNNKNGLIELRKMLGD